MTRLQKITAIAVGIICLLISIYTVETVFENGTKPPSSSSTPASPSKNAVDSSYSL